MELEGPLLRVPNLTLDKSYRASHKLIEKELTQVVESVNELNLRLEGLSNEKTCESLDGIAVRLQGLKRKMEDIKMRDDEQLHRCKARLDYLGSIENDADPKNWQKIRLAKALVDYFLRQGLYETANFLAKQYSITDLVDIEMFVAARTVIEGLQRKDCTEALKFCFQNRTKLHHLKSSFELNLRIQEFIELRRQERLTEAINYARKHLAPAATTDLKKIQVVMGSLAFQTNTECPKYKKLFAEERWNDLIVEFKETNYLSYNLPKESLLNIHLGCGLASLKTNQCYDPDKRKEGCPMCTENFRELAENLPFSHHIHSSLVCSITNQAMNDENPPMALPNGYVYSYKALNDLAEKNQGLVVCPKTKESFKFSDLKKVFIA
eukprot:TRINITY_DN5576_c0_g1_i1.p1 TRINITY_DN5576_c0_g1~~TRINITY_DN5576_c0_g1_i1.p1  ORF type:complete len:380 (+),score=61.58 TRINITY_DN5576_c0_g1_i1:39-1178(+)